MIYVVHSAWPSLIFASHGVGQEEEVLAAYTGDEFAVFRSSDVLVPGNDVPDDVEIVRPFATPAA